MEGQIRVLMQQLLAFLLLADGYQRLQVVVLARIAQIMQTVSGQEVLRSVLLYQGLDLTSVVLVVAQSTLSCYPVLHHRDPVPRLHFRL